MQSIAFAIGSAFLFAFTFFLRKQATKSLSTSTAYFIETVVQFILLLLFVSFFSPDFRKGLVFKGIGVQFALLAGITITLGVILNYLALKSGFLSKVVSITSPSQILFGLFFGFILLREVITAKQILGVIFGIIGIILVTI